jgi:hypothetical protein
MLSTSRAGSRHGAGEIPAEEVLEGRREDRDRAAADAGSERAVLHGHEMPLGAIRRRGLEFAIRIEVRDMRVLVAAHAAIGIGSHAYAGIVDGRSIQLVD